MGEGSHKYGIGQGNRPKRGNPRKKPALSAKQRLEAEERRKRGMARLKAKGDIDAGLNESERKSLKAHGDEIRGKSRENVRILNGNGELVFQNTGGRSSVRASRTAENGNMVTHNHPDDSYVNKDSLAARIGQSFSGGDLGNIVAGTAKGVRAETKGYTFDVKRTPKTSKASHGEVDAYFMRTYSGLKKANMTYLVGAKNRADYLRRWERMITVANHKAAEATAKKYGLRYTRRKK